MTLLLVPTLGCEGDPIVFLPEEEELFTFDSGLDGWIRTDLGLAGGSTYTLSADAGAALLEVTSSGAGGEAVLTREFILTPEVDYVVTIEFDVESTDGGAITPWSLVAGTSVEGGPFQFGPAISTDGGGTGSVTFSGELRVTGGLEEDDEDFQSEIRVGVGVRPLSAAARSYRIDNLLVRFVRAEVAG